MKIWFLFPGWWVDWIKLVSNYKKMKAVLGAEAKAPSSHCSLPALSSLCPSLLLMPHIPSCMGPHLYEDALLGMGRESFLLPVFSLPCACMSCGVFLGSVFLYCIEEWTGCEFSRTILWSKFLTSYTGRQRTTSSIISVCFCGVGGLVCFHVWVSLFCKVCTFPCFYTSFI